MCFCAMTSPHGDGAMEQKLAAAHHEAMEEDDMLPVMLDEGEVLEVLGENRALTPSIDVINNCILYFILLF